VSQKRLGLEQRLRAWIAHTAETVARMSPVHAVIRAAATHPGLAEITWDAQRQILATVAGGGHPLDDRRSERAVF